MGINMPARTVLFTSARKYDGKDFRWVSIGEWRYIICVDCFLHGSKHTCPVRIETMYIDNGADLEYICSMHRGC